MARGRGQTVVPFCFPKSWLQPQRQVRSPVVASVPARKCFSASSIDCGPAATTGSIPARFSESKAPWPIPPQITVPQPSSISTKLLWLPQVSESRFLTERDRIWPSSTSKTVKAALRARCGEREQPSAVAIATRIITVQISAMQGQFSALHLLASTIRRKGRPEAQWFTASQLVLIDPLQRGYYNDGQGVSTSRV